MDCWKKKTIEKDIELIAIFYSARCGVLLGRLYFVVFVELLIMDFKSSSFMVTGY